MPDWLDSENGNTLKGEADGNATASPATEEMEDKKKSGSLLAQKIKVQYSQGYRYLEVIHNIDLRTKVSQKSIKDRKILLHEIESVWDYKFACVGIEREGN